MRDFKPPEMKIRGYKSEYAGYRLITRKNRRVKKSLIFRLLERIKR